ncbi:hypothetical protein A9F13_01g08899 [Clavispora lusitaniae]|uniref:Uncharacterized protein n=1 Tax=Clavispora lusitaniae TaxID=36911 RepID=A0AA91Q5S2_CLALS|nr:hypothetical protein A9F13_01g08899 [Clavispora lusitaniae]
MPTSKSVTLGTMLLPLKRNHSYFRHQLAQGNKYRCISNSHICKLPKLKVLPSFFCSKKNLGPTPSRDIFEKHSYLFSDSPRLLSVPYTSEDL